MRLDLYIAIGIAFVALTITLLLLTLRRLTGQLVKTNEQLLVLLAAVNGGPSATRALMSLSKPPQKPLPGASKPDSVEVKKGMTVEYTLGGM